MRNGWNWKYPLSYMYPANTQLLAKWSSPSIGDQRATGCVTVAFLTINVLIHNLNTFKTIICHRHHLFLVILMVERKFPNLIPFQKTLWCYFDKVDKTFRDGSKIWEICLCLYHIWEGVKIFLRFNQLSNLLLFKNFLSIVFLSG